MTGSNFMLDTGGAKFLIDCGMQQGSHTQEEKNWVPFAYDPRGVSHLIVTHAHIDHIGRIPWLVSQGFAGRIISTPATKALAEPLLRDALGLLERRDEAPWGDADIDQALMQWDTVGYHHIVQLPDDCTLELYDAGHILGSAMVNIARGGRAVAFSGDLGGGNSPLLAAAEDLPQAQYILLESVYGDRTRPEDKNRREEVENIIEDTAARGGTVLIPAFSTERTQDLLYEIKTLMQEKRIPTMPVYVDSPLASKVTAAFLSCPDYLAPEFRKRVEGGEDIFNFPELTFVESPEASRRLESAPSPKIILAGSGMSSGGRVLAHERYILPDPKSTLLIVGYQSAGSIGRRLLDGAKKLDLPAGRRGSRESIVVRAKVEAIFGYSAHRDGEGLLETVNKAAAHIEEVFVVEGEPLSANFLTQRIRDYLGLKATAPEAGSTATINL